MSILYNRVIPRPFQKAVSLTLKDDLDKNEDELIFFKLFKPYILNIVVRIILNVFYLIRYRVKRDVMEQYSEKLNYFTKKTFFCKIFFSSYSLQKNKSKYVENF